jgi:hypothetical protein
LFSCSNLLPLFGWAYQHGLSAVEQCFYLTANQPQPTSKQKKKKQSAEQGRWLSRGNELRTHENEAEFLAQQLTDARGQKQPWEYSNLHKGNHQIRYCEKTRRCRFLPSNIAYKPRHCQGLVGKFGASSFLRSSNEQSTFIHTSTLS